MPKIHVSDGTLNIFGFWTVLGQINRGFQDMLGFTEGGIFHHSPWFNNHSAD